MTIEERKGIVSVKSGFCPPSLIIDSADWKLLTTNCIYAWRREESWMYIGSSTNGIGRILNHDLIDLNEMKSSDLVYVWYFPTFTQKRLLELELALINKLQPLYNKTGTNKGEANKKVKEERNFTLATEQLAEYLKKNKNSQVIPVSKVKGLITPRRTLYHWAKEGKHPEIFPIFGGILFIDLTKYHRVIRQDWRERRIRNLARP